MSGLLFGIGAIVAVAGAVTVGFGIPINEFSFGNTLIVAGTTAAVGGLIVIALGVVVAQLQRIAEALATRAPIRSSRPLDMFEPAAGSRQAPASGRIPFPSKPRSASGMQEPYPLGSRAESSMPADIPVDEGAAASFAPSLRNPDEPPVTVEDDVSLSPRHPVATPAPAAADLDEPARYTASFGVDGAELTKNRHEPPPAAPLPARPAHTSYFDAMWPAESKPAKTAADTDAKSNEPKFVPPPREAAAVPAQHSELGAPQTRLEDEPRAVAILKSGVVDGMGYTLYVDGSIEAELPQGTLRFASINELRSHLEKNA